MADVDVHLYHREIFEMLNSADGPVGRMLAELSDQIAMVARRVVPVRLRAGRSMRTTSRPPGFTRASIHPDMYWDAMGLIYGGAAAAADPAIFLEDPAEQMDRPYPFLTTGLLSIEGLF